MACHCSFFFVFPTSLRHCNNFLHFAHRVYLMMFALLGLFCKTKTQWTFCDSDWQIPSRLYAVRSFLFAVIIAAAAGRMKRATWSPGPKSLYMASHILALPILWWRGLSKSLRNASKKHTIHASILKPTWNYLITFNSQTLKHTMSLHLSLYYNCPPVIVSCFHQCKI